MTTNRRWRFYDRLSEILIFFLKFCVGGAMVVFFTMTMSVWCFSPEKLPELWDFLISYRNAAFAAGASLVSLLAASFAVASVRHLWPYRRTLRRRLLIYIMQTARRWWRIARPQASKRHRNCCTCPTPTIAL